MRRKKCESLLGKTPFVFQRTKRLDCGTIELLWVKAEHISAVLLDSKPKDGSILSLVVAILSSLRGRVTKVAFFQKSSDCNASSTRWSRIM